MAKRKCRTRSKLQQEQKKVVDKLVKTIKRKLKTRLKHYIGEEPTKKQCRQLERTYAELLLLEIKN